MRADDDRSNRARRADHLRVVDLVQVHDVGRTGERVAQAALDRDRKIEQVGSLHERHARWLAGGFDPRGEHRDACGRPRPAAPRSSRRGHRRHRRAPIEA